MWLNKMRYASCQAQVNVEGLGLRVIFPEACTRQQHGMELGK